MTLEQQNLALAVRPASNPFRTEKERKSHKPHYGSPLRRMEELQVPKLFKINRQTHKSNSVTHSVCLLCDQQMACVTKKTTNVTTLPIQQKNWKYLHLSLSSILPPHIVANIAFTENTVSFPWPSLWKKRYMVSNCCRARRNTNTEDAGRECITVN